MSDSAIGGYSQGYAQSVLLPAMIWLVMLWVFSWVVLVGYHTLIFRIREKSKESSHVAASTGVSIVIPVKNGSQLLENHLPFLLKQDYPAFEIIIVDDHSELSESERMKAIVKSNDQIKLVQSKLVPGKKQAIRQGIQEARYSLILCTDVDCRPASDQWIRGMVESRIGDSLVLGYSPYLKRTGLLNLWIRFETLLTAMQYFSWASVGKPYMGVGRNLMFTREWFNRVDPFHDPEQVPYGDDDLLVQQAAGDVRVTYTLDPDTFMESVPADTWAIWWRQKHRHLSAGHQYKAANWLKPGVYGLALIAHWWIVPVFCWSASSWIWMLFASGLWIRGYTHVQWTDRLGEKDTRIMYPLFEAAYTFYLACMGAYTMIYPKKKWN